MTSSPSRPPPTSNLAFSSSVAASRRRRTNSTNSASSADDFASEASSHTTTPTISAAGNLSSKRAASPFAPPALQLRRPSETSAASTSSRPHPHSAQSPTEHPNASSWKPGHRPRQHSQGYFEPSLPSTGTSGTASPVPGSTSSNMSGLTTSQLAAQAAMHIQSPQHTRKRSQTIPDPSQNGGGARGGSMQVPASSRWHPISPPPSISSFNVSNSNNLRNVDGFMGGHSLVAAAAANVAYPRSPQFSPALSERTPPPPPPLPEVKQGKEKTMKKLFSKPKNIGIHRDKDAEKKYPPLPSPGKMSMYGASAIKLANQSTTSLASDPNMSNVSIYSMANSSTSTLVPDSRTGTLEKEKDRHKHHIFSRQKNKIREKDEYNLPLSSASSTSKPTDPNAPQPLYSFAPSSPGHASTFAKSVSGLDFRHARGLRDKKIQEKAPSNLSSSVSILESGFRDRDGSFGAATSEWPGVGSYSGGTTYLSNSNMPTPLTNELGGPAINLAALGSSFNLPGITPDDAWPLLKARLLHIFEGEDPRPPVEDFNHLVSVHLWRCIQRRAPTVIIEDLTELLHTGFSSLDQTLRNVPDERLVPLLVRMWVLVFNTILPFLQAVFLPLDLEFKGAGPFMKPREASEFWGAALPGDNPGDLLGMSSSIDDRPINSNNATPTGPSLQIPRLGEDLDVRRITLLTFRDTVILPRHEVLIGMFSRLSLDSINAGVHALEPLQPPPPISAGTRPGTASSTDAALNPLTSGSSPSTASLPPGNPTTTSIAQENAAALNTANRSRATSSTSAGSFSSNPAVRPPLSISTASGQSSNLDTTSSTSTATLISAPTPLATSASTIYPGSHIPLAGPHGAVIVDSSARVTEVVGRMLQCMSVLTSLQSGDEAQTQIEELTKELKWNWLGRGRTGRQRRGFVGTRVRTGTGPGAGSGSALPGKDEAAPAVDVKG